MENSKVVGLLYVILIAIIGIGGTGFFWYYANEVSDFPEAPLIPIQQSNSLTTSSAESGRVLGQFVENPLLPSEVLGLFKEYCQRPASVNELDTWSGKSEQDLLIALDSSQTTYGRLNGPYVDECFGEVVLSQ